jgi:tetratricopeptide (TPR) repeat protein
MYQHANVYHLWRHILFIFPPLSILVAVSWISFIETQSVKFQRIAFLVLVLGFIEVIYFQITTFPHIASYFNPISGGLKKNYDLHETDYYYNSLKPAVDWFLKNEYPKYAKSDTIVVASNAQHILNEYFKAHGNIKTAYVRYAERFNTPTNYAFFHRSLIPEQDLTEKHWIRDPQIVYISGVDSAVFSIILHYADSGLFRGIAAINDNKFAIALPELMRYHAKYPKDFASLKYLGIAFTQLGQPDSGLKYLRASIEIKDDLQSRLFYGLNLLNKNDIVNGISVLEQIVLVTPTTSEQANVILQSLQMLIQVYRSTGNMAKANEYQNLLAQYQQMMSSSQ